MIVEWFDSSMKSYSSSLVTASFFLSVVFSYTIRFAIAQNHTTYVDNRDCISNSLSPSSSAYTQLPHGQTTYDLGEYLNISMYMLYDVCI